MATAGGLARRRSGHGGMVAAFALASAVALLGAACTGGLAPKAGPSPTGSGLKVTSFTATPVSGGQVNLAWSGSGKGIYGYELYRDGRFIEIFTTLTYTDYHVQPGRTYEYKVSVQDSRGDFSDEATTTVTTPAAPPLSDARLAGRYGATLKFLSENYTNIKVGQTFRERWTIRPRCATGACSVVVHRGQIGEVPAKLRQHGNLYTGTGTDLGSRCGSTKTRQTSTITIKVVRARFIQGVWRAGAFSGTQSDYTPAGSGCTVGQSKLSVSGRILL